MSRRRHKGTGNWWDDRSQLEKILVCAAIATVFVLLVSAIVLILFLTKDSARQDPCLHGACLLPQSSELIQRTDPSVDPCEDFYRFSCGSFLKNAIVYKKLGKFFSIREKSKRQVRGLYEEPINDDDHPTIKISKRFYMACLNETAIENDGLNTMKEVLRALGGWPVVEGSNWDESRFWWLGVSYKLREFGFFYATFLELSVAADPKNSNRFIYKIVVPELKGFGDTVRYVDKQGLMVDVALAFGAEMERTLQEITEMFDFILEMENQSYLRRIEGPHQRLTVADFQRQYLHINWLEFINTIVGPGVKIYRDDFVLFPPAETLHKWFKFILGTAKRVQANYIIWKAIEESIPYLPVLQNSKIDSSYIRDEFGHQESRQEFCMKQIRMRFLPCPIDIMYVRRYLPQHKKNEVESIMKSLKVELVDLLKETKWISNDEKTSAINRVLEMTEIIGAPEDYFDDEILDDLYIDLDQSPSSNFITLLSRVNRNFESWKYNQIYTTSGDSKIIHWKLETPSFIGDYFWEENILNIPATILQDVIFDEARPKYLNYGSMGTLMGHHFFQIFGDTIKIFDKDGYVINDWASGFKSFFKNTSNCITRETNKFNITNMHASSLLLQQSMGLKISYEAYLKWAKTHEAKEFKLIGVEYTPKQLFWISAASYFCQPSNRYTFKNPGDQNLFDFIVSVSTRSNPQFASNFDCPLGSKMNPVDKCTIF